MPFSPKGHDIVAQGNALGIDHPKNITRPERARRGPVRPFQGDRFIGISRSQGVALGYDVMALRAEERAAKNGEPWTARPSLGNVAAISPGTSCAFGTQVQEPGPPADDFFTATTRRQTAVFQPHSTSRSRLKRSWRGRGSCETTRATADRAACRGTPCRCVALPDCRRCSGPSAARLSCRVR